MSEVLHHRGKVAALTRSRSSDDPDLLGASRDLAAAKLAAYVERVVSNAPPLTIEQRDRIAALLSVARGAGDPDAA
ncbi:MAG: hypothetical protein ACR2JU_10600 [Nocardioidaceae bacterium]